MSFTEYLKRERHTFWHGTFLQRLRATFLLGSLPLMVGEYLIVRPDEFLIWLIFFWIEWILEAIFLAAFVPPIMHWLRPPPSPNRDQLD